MFVVTCKIEDEDELRYYSECVASMWSIEFSKAKFFQDIKAASFFLDHLDTKKKVHHTSKNTISPEQLLCNALKISGTLVRNVSGFFEILEIQVYQRCAKHITGQVTTAPTMAEILSKLSDEEQVVLRSFIR